jgi:hypothetical protein
MLFLIRHYKDIKTFLITKYKTIFFYFFFIAQKFGYIILYYYICIVLIIYKRADTRVTEE